MTAQISEMLIYKDRKRTLFSTPLQEYDDPAHPLPRFTGWTTACWRGYAGTWIFQENMLYLTEIRTRIDGREAGMKAVFPHLKGSNLSAPWYSGVLRIVGGRELHYVHMGFGSEYEEDWLLHVWKGKLILEERFDNRSRGKTEYPPPESAWEAVDRRIIYGDTPDRIGYELTDRVADVFGPEEAAFLHAVRAAPGEVTPRLVYADWLEERGDFRAALIRVEEERRPLVSDDPMHVSFIRRRDELREQVKSWLWLKLMDYQLPANDRGSPKLSW